MRRMSQAVVAALSAGVVCATGAGALATSSPSQRPGPWHSPPPAPTAPATMPMPMTPPTPTGKPASPRHVWPCAPWNLRPAIAESEGAAGSTYITFTYTNVGPHTCVVKGYPNVKFVDKHGRLIGAPAARMPTLASGTTVAPPVAVTLAPRAKARFVVREVHAGIPAGCDKASTYTPAAGLAIMPAGGGAPQFVKLTDNACKSRSVQQLFVGPLTT